MASPAWQHKQRFDKAKEIERIKTRAAKAERSELEALTKNKENFELLVTSVENDIARMSKLPQGSARLPLKDECVKLYMPYIETYLAGDDMHINPVLVHVMIWCFDLGYIAEAMRLAEAAIVQKQPMPERFKSSLSVFVADEVFDWSKKQRDSGSAVSPYFDIVFAALDEWPLHDKQRAKYCKFAAELAEKERDFVRMAEYCERVLGYDPDAQVKGLRATAEKELAKAAEAAKYSLKNNPGAENSKQGNEYPPAGGESEAEDKANDSSESDDSELPPAFPKKKGKK